MTATFHIPDAPDWREALARAFRLAHKGDVIQLATRAQYNKALNVIADYPGVIIRVVEVVKQPAESLDKIADS